MWVVVWKDLFDDKSYLCATKEQALTFIMSRLWSEDPRLYRCVEEALDDFEPTNLWRALRNGQTWVESSNEKDVRSRMEHGDVLQNLYFKTERQWRTAK